MSYIYSLEKGLDVLSGTSFIISIVFYVLTAMGLYTLAQRRGIHKPWLAWIPVVNVWILGSLSDQYRYVVKGEVRSKRKVLLTLNILLAVLCVAIYAVAISLIISTMGGAIYGVSESEMLGRILGPVMGMLGLLLPMAGVGIAAAIIRYMALYDVYTSCDPQNNVLFLVLSIIIGVTEPFFLFFNRKKDAGMPPRRPEPAWQPPQPQQEPWENGKDYL